MQLARRGCNWVLKDPTQAEPPQGFTGPGPEPRFLGSEWIIELCFGPPQTSLVTAAAMGLTVTPLPPRFADAPLCVTGDPGSGKLVLIPCWEIFRFYYAQAPVIARQVFEFPRWTDETFERLLGYFGGHHFQEVARPSVPSLDAATQLRAIGRNAAVSYACSGSVQIRAVPPFAGPTVLEVVGLPTVAGDRDALFVQQILASRALPARRTADDPHDKGVCEQNEHFPQGDHRGSSIQRSAQWMKRPRRINASRVKPSDRRWGTEATTRCIDIHRSRI